MITKDNIKYAIQSINPGHLQKELDKPYDYIWLQSHVFNAGSYEEIQCMDFSEFAHCKASQEGSLFCHKDQFHQLLQELEIFED